MAKKLGFGVVGCGMIAHFHARAINDLKQGELRGTADVVAGNAASVAKLADGECDSTTDFRDLLKRDDIDIITICTPSGAHKEIAVAAANAGKHLVVEKPLDVTLARCDAVIRACDRNQVQCCVIYPSRFGDANRELKKAVDAGKFGRLTLGDTYVKWWRDQNYYDQGGWRGTLKLDGGGALMNQSVHNVDLLQWIMGPVESVSAYTATLAHKRIEVEDTAVAALRFRSGALGVIEGASSVYPGLLKRIEIHGDQGSAVIEQDDLLLWEFAKETAADTRVRKRFARKTGAVGGASDPGAIGTEGHRRQLDDFCQAILSKGRPQCDGREGRKSVEIILAIYKSARTGKRVTLPLK